MKKIYMLIVTIFALVIASAGYAASSGEEESTDSSSTMGMHADKLGMHGGAMMHQGMMGHHMMKSNVSPVTIMIQPGMMPMMGHSMMYHGAKSGHEGGGMSQEIMTQRQKMMKDHMERMEQRIENIEALLSELVELQKKDE